jgi:hypothetical protein
VHSHYQYYCCYSHRSPPPARSWRRQSTFFVLPLSAVFLLLLVFSFGGVADFAGFTGFGFAAAALDGGVGVALTGVDGASALLIVGAKQNLKFLPTRELLNSSSRIF